MLWQGKPDWSRLAVCALHARKVALYLAVLLGVRGGFDLAGGASLAQSLADLSGFVLLALIAVGLLALTGWLFARSTLYTITTHRLVMRFGVALSISINLPYPKIESVELRERGGGFGDIAVTTNAATPLSWVVMWPHARPWRFSPVVPMLRCVPDAAGVAATLARALRARSETSPPPEVATLSEAGRRRDDHDAGRTPLPPLIAAASLAVFALVSVAWIRASGGGQKVEPVDPAQVVAQVDLHFEDREGGHVAVIDAASEQTIETLLPGADNFMRATLRGLAKARQAAGEDDDEPFRILQTADGRLLLLDPVTGRQIDLWAFGETNAQAFARLLSAGRAAQRVSHAGTNPGAEARTHTFESR